jgi:hypothetical protein
MQPVTHQAVELSKEKHGNKQINIDVLRFLI